VFGTYQQNGFYLDFDFNNSLNSYKLGALKANQWLDMDTRAVSLSWTVLNIWSDIYYISTVFIENPGNNVYKVSFKLQTAIIYDKS